jgi:hypothetical protein
MRALIVAAALLVSVSTAHADAIFQWVNNPGTNFTGTLRMSDEAYFAGGISGAENIYHGTMWYAAEGHNWEVVTAFPVTVNWSYPIFLTGADPDEIFSFDLTVVADGLSGVMHTSGRYSFEYTDGTEALWSNFRVDTETAPHLCLEDHVDMCDSWGGRWLLTSAPTQSSVPAPSALALLLAGAGGLFRRKRP